MCVNTDYRKDALNDVQIVVVPEDCDNYEGTVLDSSMPGFAGLVVSLETDSAGLKTGKVVIKESLIPSSESFFAAEFIVCLFSYQSSQISFWVQGLPKS